MKICVLKRLAKSIKMVDKAIVEIEKIGNLADISPGYIGDEISCIWNALNLDRDRMVSLIERQDNFKYENYVVTKKESNNVS